MVSRVDRTAERRVIAALARGVLGEAYAPSVTDEILQTISLLASDKDRNDLLRGLRLLDTKAGARLMTGRGTPASWLSASEAEAVLQAFKRSRIKGKQMLAARSEERRVGKECGSGGVWAR